MRESLCVSGRRMMVPVSFLFFFFCDTWGKTTESSEISTTYGPDLYGFKVVKSARRKLKIPKERKKGEEGWMSGLKVRKSRVWTVLVQLTMYFLSSWGPLVPTPTFPTVLYTSSEGNSPKFLHSLFTSDGQTLRTRQGPYTDTRLSLHLDPRFPRVLLKRTYLTFSFLLSPT